MIQSFSLVLTEKIDYNRSITGKEERYGTKF